MVRDRYLHVVLTAIAVLLLLNLFKSQDRPLATIETPAQAQPQTESRFMPVVPTPIERQASNLRVSAIGGNQVNALRDVVALGDGKTFVVSNPGGFVVYKVEPINPNSRN